MNASVEFDPIPASWRAERRQDPAIAAREGILEVPGDVSLHHGSTLSELRIAWRLSGPANAPIVAALGGISAHRPVALYAPFVEALKGRS